MIYDVTGNSFFVKLLDIAFGLHHRETSNESIIIKHKNCFSFPQIILYFMERLNDTINLQCFYHTMEYLISVIDSIYYLFFFKWVKNKSQRKLNRLLYKYFEINFAMNVCSSTIYWVMTFRMDIIVLTLGWYSGRFGV